MNWKKIFSYTTRNYLLTKTPQFDIISYPISNDKVKNKIKILFLSDIHAGTCFLNFDTVLTQIKKITPDFVLFGGDLASRSDYLEEAFLFLKAIPAELAKFAVIGNWELKISRCKNISYWRAKFATADFQLLHNSYAQYMNFLFYGISPSRGIKIKKPIALLPKKNTFFRVILAHNPDDIVSLHHDFDLAFAGHTHAGQIRLPIVGSLKTSSKYWKTFDYGLHRRNDGAHLIISSGLGTSFLPLRIFCRPEIVLVTINF